MILSYGRIRLEHTVEFHSIGAVDFKVVPLNENNLDVGIGCNGSIFSAMRADEDSDLDHCYYALKVCAYNKNHPMSGRFKREIKAMKIVSQNNLQGVVSFYGDGTCQVKHRVGPKYHSAYLMEKADMDLKCYLEANPVSLKQRVLLCRNILKGLKELHDVQIYHRDIKPENVLFINNVCKLADLGLVRFRDNDDDCDKPKEKIGPAGFMSPEAINKKFSISHYGIEPRNWQVREQSDVYQVAKLLWCILFGDIPNGIIKGRDLGEISEYEYLYGNFFKKCLSYHYENRPDISSALQLFAESTKKYL
jgi:serine/threonine protein kinase